VKSTSLQNQLVVLIVQKTEVSEKPSSQFQNATNRALSCRSLLWVPAKNTWFTDRISWNEKPPGTL